MENIRSERKRLKYTQTVLANKLGIAPNSLSEYESGNRTPSLAVLIKLANFFACSTDYLLGRTDTRTAAVVECDVDNKHVKIELDKNYYKTLTLQDVEKMIVQLKNVGFDVEKLAR